ncbi:MAG: dihydrolipoyllysine-residue succinyltransferase [Verrucomicrobia bacterium]|nr:dihydrolipoyllysine-residue succinyltransferase [Verrucomicrobiota bacterium]
MKVEIKIPTMGESVSEATLSRILKPSGSYVKRDEEILELETDKVNQVLYAPQSGKLELTVQVGQTVTIGQVIGHVDTEGKVEEVAPPPAPPPTPSKESARVLVPDFVASIQEAPKVTPPPPAPERAGRKKMSSLRKVIAQKLVEAKNQTAMLTTFNEIDLSAVMEIRSREKDNFLKKYGAKLGFMSFFVKGAVAALKAVPEINAYIDGDEIVTLESYDIGVAVSTERGLMVPVLRGCDEKSFGAIEKDLEAYAKKAREGKIGIDDMRGGSFTITNGGVFGSLLSTPILNPPQSAILGMHAIVRRPVAVNEQVVIRPMMYVALSYDHRIVDGREAVLFLVHLKQSLEEPSRLLLDL